MALDTYGRETTSLEAWCDLIRRRCGLTFRTAQLPTVLGCVHDHVQAKGTSERAYYEQLAEAPEGDPEWIALVEQLVNHESSFFRHPASFDVLRTHLLPDLRTARGRGRLNLLSAGCSTGQEAYSMAMVAMDHDARGDFAVWGCDISRQAIDAARRARFGRRAIAGTPEAYRQRFLIACGEGMSSEYEICEELRRRVRFSAVNLFAADAGINLSYDVIFCHNVLIYFAPEAATRLLNSLATRLRPGGYLLLGPGEGPGDQPLGLEPLHVPGVRGFRRTRQAGTERRS